MTGIKAGFLFVASMLLAGCATVSQWNPPPGRQKVAIAAIFNPSGSQDHIGITVFGNGFIPVDMGYNINQEVADVERQQLVKAGRYDIVDMPVDPKLFASATRTWDMGWTLNTMAKPLADQLVQDAKGRGIDYIIAIIDVRPGFEGPGGWGLYQRRGRCSDAFIDYFIFVLDAHTGVTLASDSRGGFRQIEDLDWDVGWANIPANKQAEALSDLKSMVDEFIPWTLSKLGIGPDNHEPSNSGGSFCSPW